MESSMIKVMIVEDDQIFLSYLCRIIASDSHLELFAAVRDGISAKHSLLRGEPDVLLVDLGLPDRSGIDVIRSARKQSVNLDIMVITIFDDESQVMACIEAGATGFLLR
ncbi:MAG: chemotaxis protein CheY, partial [Gammaproteobacteria bacterium SG8_11]